MYERYYGFNIVGKKGKIVSVLGTDKEPYQGAKVRFPVVHITDADGNRVSRSGFEFPFDKDELEKINETVPHPKSRTRLKGYALNMRKGAVRRMKERGETIQAIASHFEVNRRTIRRWLG